MKFKVTLSSMVPITAEIEVEVEEGENNADRACELARQIAEENHYMWNIGFRNEDIRVDNWEVIGD